MTELSFAASAVADVMGILEHIGAEAGATIVAKFRVGFRHVFLRLIDHPASGSLRPEFGPNIRITVLRPYTIIYRYDTEQNTVTILRIVHGRRHVTTKTLQFNWERTQHENGR